MSAKAPRSKASQSKSKKGGGKGKKRLKDLMLTTMAAGGVLSIAGWEAQAHGNRSSPGSVAEEPAPQNDKDKSDKKAKSDSKPKPKSKSKSGSSSDR